MSGYVFVNGCVSTLSCGAFDRWQMGMFGYKRRPVQAMEDHQRINLQIECLYFSITLRCFLSSPLLSSASSLPSYVHHSSSISSLPSYVHSSSISSTFCCTQICRNNIHSVPLAIGLRLWIRVANIWYQIRSSWIRSLLWRPRWTPWRRRCRVFSTRWRKRRNA
jgi:hypothetical protein